MDDRSQNPQRHPGDPGERLESWKEIAGFFGKTVTTVQRWEQSEGLPVHRLTHAKKGSVFAFKQELEEWRLRRTRGPSGQADAGDSASQRTSPLSGGDTRATPGSGPIPQSPVASSPSGDELLRADPARPIGLVRRFGASTVVVGLLLTTVVVGLAWVNFHSGSPPHQAPTNLTVVSRRPGSVSLSWTDNSSTETRFDISQFGKVVGSTAANVVATEFTGLDAGTSYHWDVRACNASGCSPWHGVEGKTPDGSDALTDPPSSPSAVGGATDILFARMVETGKLQIYVTHAEGGIPIRLTNTSSNDFMPVWSPDRTKVAFGSDRTGFSEIFVMNADGSNQVNLTNLDPAQDSAPTWSPDGTRIAFTSRRSGRSEIWVMRADGSDPINLSKAPGINGEPAWSPDGSRITFMSTRSGSYDIYVMEANGSNQTRLTTDGAEHAFPRWSPNSRQIAYGCRRHENWDVYVMDADGSRQTNLTNHQAIDDQPSWSPDGTRIVFRSNRDGNSEIFSMNPDGSGLVKLTHWGGGDHEPDWGFPPSTGIPAPPGSTILRRPSK